MENRARFYLYITSHMDAFIAHCVFLNDFFRTCRHEQCRK